jgi:hypothetical protein
VSSSEEDDVLLAAASINIMKYKIKKKIKKNTSFMDDKVQMEPY